MQSTRETQLQRPPPALALLARRANLHWEALCLLLLLTLQLGCGPVRLVSPYDEQIDSGTSQAHTEIAEFVAKMALVAGKPGGTYESDANFYAELTAKVSTLKLRAAAQAKNDITVRLFEELLTSIDKLRQLHESGAAGGLSPPLGKPALQGIDVICESILKFEIAKRRGESD